MRGSLRRFLGMRGAPLRGRVSRVALVRGSELSVTVRFGLEELETAKKLVPGAVLELVEVIEEKQRAERQPKKQRDPRASMSPFNPDNPVKCPANPPCADWSRCDPWDCPRAEKGDKTND